MLNFDYRGYLKPNKNLASSCAELYDEFVEKFNNTNRHQLYDNYIRYSNDLKNVCGGIKLIQWVDGSFVTKKDIPKDIDVVTFIEHDVNFDLSNFVYPESIKKYNIDGYIVKVYPRKHPKIALYMGDWAYWMDRFDKTRRNRAGNRYPKGFLEINF